MKEEEILKKWNELYDSEIEHHTGENMDWYEVADIRQAVTAFIKKSMASIREETMKELPEYHSIKNRADAEDYWTGYNHAIAIMQTKINKSIINNIRE